MKFRFIHVLVHPLSAANIPEQDRPRDSLANESIHSQLNSYKSRFDCLAVVTRLCVCIRTRNVCLSCGCPRASETTRFACHAVVRRQPEKIMFACHAMVRKLAYKKCLLVMRLSVCLRKIEVCLSCGCLCSTVTARIFPSHAVRPWTDVKTMFACHAVDRRTC